jgi:hypothetical protein
MSRRRHDEDDLEPLPRGVERQEITTLTSRQMIIMELVLRGNGKDPDGRFIPIDLDQLLERLPYETTKQSMQFSVRALIGRGMLEKGARQNRRGRSRVTLCPTAFARQQLRLGIQPNWVQPEGSEGLDLEGFVDDNEG